MAVADQFLFPPSPIISVGVTGQEARYAIKRIFCVGRNFADHAREMGAEVDRQAPFYFMKDAASIVESGATIAYPPGTANLHHEVEFVVALGATCWQVTTAQAADAVFGYACGLDLTRRDLQNDAKAKGKPWDFSKNFEHSAPITAIVPKAQFGPIADQHITLTVDGMLKQNGKLSDMVWSVPELISYLSRFYHLGPGDLIYTGTPAGVGPLMPENRVSGKIDGLPELQLTIGPAEARF